MLLLLAVCCFVYVDSQYCFTNLLQSVQLQQEGSVRHNGSCISLYIVMFICATVLLGLHSRTQGHVAPYMAQFGPVRNTCWPSGAGQPMTMAFRGYSVFERINVRAQIGPGE